MRTIRNRTVRVPVWRFIHVKGSSLWAEPCGVTCEKGSAEFAGPSIFTARFPFGFHDREAQTIGQGFPFQYFSTIGRRDPLVFFALAGGADDFQRFGITQEFET